MMPRSIAILFSLFFCTLLQAQESDKDKKPQDVVSTTYCSKLKDGNTVILSDNRMVITSVTLNDGSQLKPDGSIVRKNGKNEVLQNGQCIDSEGVIHADTKRKK